MDTFSLSRRTLLKSFGLAALGGACLRPSFLLAEGPSAGSGKNVVIINLLGGLDGLAAFPYFSGPLAQAINSQLRPDLKVPSSSIVSVQGQTGLPNQLGLHPAFLELHQVAGGHINVVQNYGIPGDPGRSHDTCQTLMSLGATQISGGENVGFLARLMDQQNWDSFQYWSFLSENPSDTNTTKRPPIVVNNLESLQFPQLWWEGSGDLSLAQELNDTLIRIQLPKDSLGIQQKENLESMSTTVSVVRKDILPQKVGGNIAGNYTEEGIGMSLRDTARVLKAKQSSVLLNLRSKDTLFLLGQGGYDTHSNQASTDPNEGLSGNLLSLAHNLAVFWSDLALANLLNDTVIVLYSEFGRTVFQNGTRGLSTVGTDHGHGSATMILGGAIRGGVSGEPPTLSNLLDEEYNALHPSTDYRDIFSDIFAWMNISSQSLFNDPSYVRSSLGLFT